jgi:transposase-like protein
MKRTPGLGHIVLVSLLIVTYTQTTERQLQVWDWGSIPAGRTRRHTNPQRNRERWARRMARRRRRQPAAKRAGRRRQRERTLQQILEVPPNPALAAQERERSIQAIRSWGKKQRQKKPALAVEVAAEEDPLVDLRQTRGWIDHIDEEELWAMLIRVRRPHGPECPECGERDPRYLKQLGEDYRGGLGRWQCRVCAEAGDPGEGGTFTPLTGTVLDGIRIDVRTLWLIVEMFANGEASVETSDEARVSRHTTDRLFRLFRAAIYQGRSVEPILLEPEDIVEFDEVYITAGLKGQAGGLELDRDPRQRGLERRGRGTWDNDRLPVFGLLCRGGEVRLVVLRNVQTETIRPIVEQMVQQGARVYTDGYCIYHFLSREGYQHEIVNHGAGEYALDLDGDGKCEAHCNTMQKRRIIGERFIRVFESAATGQSGVALIKHHHNVGGLPPDMQFELVEPLRDLFKDEVRQVGKMLALPHRLVWRHPSPGPGLAVRILGEITWERLQTLRQADAIFLQELGAAGWYDQVAQAFAVLLPDALSTGVAGDVHRFGQTMVLRAVVTDDFMTASPAPLPYELLIEVSTRILNEVADVTRVVYDLSTKPPATIEWL